MVCLVVSCSRLRLQSEAGFADFYYLFYCLHSRAQPFSFLTSSKVITLGVNWAVMRHINVLPVLRVRKCPWLCWPLLPLHCSEGPLPNPLLDTSGFRRCIPRDKAGKHQGRQWDELLSGYQLVPLWGVQMKGGPTRVRAAGAGREKGRGAVVVVPGSSSITS